jgi:hypothetical protein
MECKIDIFERFYRIACSDVVLVVEAVGTIASRPDARV